MRLPIVGETFLDRYQVAEVLGRGGFAVVFRARDLLVHRDVALKVLLGGEEGYDPSVVSRFQREAQVQAGLQDPHTVKMFDFGRSDTGLLYMVFEYVEGADLARFVADRGPQPQSVIVGMLQQLLSALREAHAAGILHRDIKPANILVYGYMGNEHRVKLLDFGIAKPLQPRSDAATITRTGSIVGTPRYMAPEQICGEDLSPSSDLYSLGLVALELVTGRAAVGTTEKKELLRRQLDPHAFAVPSDAPVSPSFRQFLGRMVDKDPARRFASADAALVALREVQPWRGLEDQTNAASPMVKLAASLLGVALLSGGVVTMVATSATQETEPAPRRAPARSVGKVAPSPVAPLDPRPRQAEPTPEVAAAPAVTIQDPGEEALGDPCMAKAASFYGVRESMVRVMGVNRTWETYVPLDYEPSKRHPVVVAFDSQFHNGGLNSMVEELRDVADEKNFVVIAPRSLSAVSKYEDASDIPFVREALHETSQIVCLDPSRVYAVGQGGGAGFLDRLLCEMEFSAALGTHNRRSPGESYCTPLRPTPFMYIAGRSDRFAPIYGKLACNGRYVMSMEEQDAEWRERNECRGKSEAFSSHPEGDCKIWRDCAAPYASCLVAGGHYWPKAGDVSGFLLATCPSPATTYPYGEAMWEFFQREGRSLRSEIAEPAAESAREPPHD